MTDEPDDANVPELSPEEETAIHDLLASLPDPAMPADVEERIAAALAAEMGLTEQGGTLTVLARPGADGAGDRSFKAASTRTRGAWRSHLTQIAAGVAVLALAGGVAVTIAVRHDDSNGATSASGATKVSESHTAYTDANFTTDVQALLVSASSTSPPSPPSAPSTPSIGATPASSSSVTASTGSRSTGSPSAVTSSVSPSARSLSYTAVTDLMTNTASRDTCVAALAGDTTEHAIVIDVGSYDGRAAAVVVLPDMNQTSVVDVWVVGPTCSDADKPFPYSYHEVPRP